MTLDRIAIKDLLIRGIVGVNDWEREKKQDIIVNLQIFTDLKASAQNDDLEQTVNYRAVSKRTIELVENSKRFTVEALATDIAKLCLQFARVERVIVRVEKPGALRFAKSVSVEIDRTPADF